MNEDRFGWPIGGKDIYDLDEKYTHTNGKTYELKRVEVYRQEYGVEDHGILTLYVGLQGGLNTSFGGYAHDTPVFNKEGKNMGRVETDFGRDVVKEVLRVFDVYALEDIMYHRIYAVQNPDVFASPACLGFVSQDRSRVFVVEDLLVKHFPDEAALEKKVERLNAAFDKNRAELFVLEQTTQECFDTFLHESLLDYHEEVYTRTRDVDLWNSALEILIGTVKNHGAKRGSFRYSAANVIEKLGL